MCKKQIIAVLSLVSLCGTFALSQQTGSPILTVYSDFYKGLARTDNSTAFEISRVYLGYKGMIGENFYAEAKLDIGSPEDQSQYSLIRRYAYFKTAYLKYQKNNLTLFFGLFGMLQFEDQENNWGYRYIKKSFMDEYSFGPSADIGFAAKYDFSEYVEADITFSNGEGYKNLQTDNTFKSAAGITFHPIHNSTVRFYYDITHKEINQSTFSFFLGYFIEKFRVGAEWDVQLNKSNIAANNLNGLSVYGTYIINEKWGLFGRYDRLTSNILEEEAIPWNIYKDGTAITGGIEYSPIKKIKCALNYQDWYSYAANGPDKVYVFLNVEFKL